MQRGLAPTVIRRTWLSLFFVTAALLLANAARADFTRIEEDHPSVTYTGTWTTYPGDVLSGGTLRATTQTGATASVTFNGTGIAWISFRGDRVREGAHIYIDGKFVETIAPLEGTQADDYSKIRKFYIGGLPNGTHVLTIEVSAAWTGATALAVDAFHIESGAVTELRQENDASITYTGNWMDIDDPSVNGGSVLASREAGATATLRFRGTGVHWIGYRCACASGIGRITLDGAELPQGFYPQESPIAPRDAQAIVFHREGLTNTDHVLKIEVTGNSTQQSPWLVIDAFRITTGSTDGADTTPPQIALREPDQGSTVYTPQVLLGPDTFDNVGVTAVNYYVDGVQITPFATTAPNNMDLRWWWDTTGFGYGPHTLYAVARDAAGNETRSASVNVTLAERTTLSLTSPAPGSQVTGQVTLRASTAGTITSGVSFYAQSSSGYVNFLGTDTTAPYELTRNTSGIPSGSTFQLWAQAIDPNGYPATSSRITVTVQH
jgi:hypothetical protein